MDTALTTNTLFITENESLPHDSLCKHVEATFDANMDDTFLRNRQAAGNGDAPSEHSGGSEVSLYSV